jgi:alpha-L-fucosidase
LKQWDESGHDTDRFMQLYFDQSKCFNPEGFDPESWAIAARKAGMKYVVFTTKHHDGFCMYDSQYTDFRATADLAKQVFDAFRKQGLGIGVYYSKPDWHHADYWCAENPRLAREANYDPAKHPQRWSRYVDFVHNQISELLTNYGKVDILWLDGDWVRAPQEDLQMGKIARMARKAQPGILIVDRNVGGEYENYRTPEQTVPDTPPDGPWESCITMAEQWSYKPNDTYKTARELIHLLIGIVAKGGNLLLNVGPDSNGNFDPTANQRLAEIGEWMDINAAAIHQTQAVAPFMVGNLCVTRKKNLTYIFYLAGEAEKAPPETLKIGFIAKAEKVRLLGSKAVLRHQCGTEGLVISVPHEYRQSPPCQHAWVFEITEATKTV